MWKCLCGWKNRPMNDVCGGSSGGMGCKRPRDEVFNSNGASKKMRLNVRPSPKPSSLPPPEPQVESMVIKAARIPLAFSLGATRPQPNAWEAAKAAAKAAELHDIDDAWACFTSEMLHGAEDYLGQRSAAEAFRAGCDRLGSDSLTLGRLQADAGAKSDFGPPASFANAQRAALSVRIQSRLSSDYTPAASSTSSAMVASSLPAAQAMMNTALQTLPGAQPLMFSSQVVQEITDGDTRYLGRIKNFREMSGGGGFGFIDSAEARAKYGRDTYIHMKQIQQFKVGDQISFTVYKNPKGEPQARNVMYAADMVFLRAKQMVEKQQHDQKLFQKVPQRAASSGIMSEEEAKAFQASLRKNKM